MGPPRRAGGLCVRAFGGGGCRRGWGEVRGACEGGGSAGERERGRESRLPQLKQGTIPSPRVPDRSNRTQHHANAPSGVQPSGSASSRP